MTPEWDTVTKEVARALALTIVPGALPRVVGTLAPHHPMLYVDLRPRYDHWRLELRSLDLPKPIGFRPGRAEPELQIGDPMFDAGVTTSGDCAVLLARLDELTRADVLHTCRYGVSYAGRAFVFDGHGPPDARLVLALVDQMTRTARRLLLPLDVLAALEVRAATDRAVGVRLRAALALLASPAATAERIAPFLDASHPELRRRAALRLPAHPHAEAVLLDLVAMDADFELIDALASVGTPRALALLRPLARQAFGLTELARAAQRAIAAIRTRHGEPGALSASLVRGGDLSEAASPGALSVPRRS